MPVVADFTDDDGNDTMQEDIELNYNQVKLEVKQIVADELKRIAEDESLRDRIFTAQSENKQ